MKVLFVIPGNVYGGAHNQATHASHILRSTGDELVVLLPNEDGDAAARLRGNGVTTWTMRLRRLREPKKILKNIQHILGLPGQVLRLRRILSDGEFDVVQAHGITQFDVALAGRLSRTPVVWQLLDTRAPRLLCRVIQPLLLTLPKVVMCTGLGTLRAHIGDVVPKCAVVPYLPPIRDDLFEVESNERWKIRQRLSVSNEAILVVSIGNINPQKGFEHLIKAVSEIDRPDLCLRIRGSKSPQHPAYFTMVTEMASAEGLIGDVIGSFEPDVSVNDLLNAADIFCVSSEPNSEGIPTVILEAMTIGVPILSANVGGVSSAIRTGVDGLLHQSRDSHTLATHIMLMAKDAESLSLWSSRSRERIAELAPTRSFKKSTEQALSIALTASLRKGER